MKSVGKHLFKPDKHKYLVQKQDVFLVGKATVISGLLMTHHKFNDNQHVDNLKIKSNKLLNQLRL